MVELLSYHQVTPDYLEFLFMFGSTTRRSDIRFSGFRQHTCLKANPAATIDALNRSEQYFALSFNLRTIQMVDPNSYGPISWSIRQTAIYHRFDLRFGSTLWLITRAQAENGSIDLKERIEHLTGPQGKIEDRDFTSTESCFISSLAVLSMLIHWAEEHWQRYLQIQDDAIAEEVCYSPHASCPSRAYF